MPLGKPARPMPVAESVAQFLSGLLGKPVQVDKSREPVTLVEDPDRPPVVTVMYLDDQGGLGGLCVAELSIAAGCGAALALMPPQVAQEAVQDRALPENLGDNWHEVANVMVQLVNGPAVTHLRTGDMALGATDDVRDFAEKAPGHRHFAVTIIGYPTGHMSFYAL